MGTAIRHPVPDRVKQSFVIFDIRALWCSGWASECPDVKNYKWQLNPVWHRMLYSCTHNNGNGWHQIILVWTIRWASNYSPVLEWGGVCVSWMLTECFTTRSTEAQPSSWILSSSSTSTSWTPARCPHSSTTMSLGSCDLHPRSSLVRSMAYWSRAFLSPALTHGMTYRSTSPQHRLCTPSDND